MTTQRRRVRQAACGSSSVVDHCMSASPVARDSMSVRLVLHVPASFLTGSPGQGWNLTANEVQARLR